MQMLVGQIVAPTHPRSRGSLLILLKCQCLTDDVAPEMVASLWDFSVKLRVISGLALAHRWLRGPIGQFKV